MKRIKRIFISLILLTAIACDISSAQGTHPRLWFGPGDTMAIRIKATTQGTTAYNLWQVLKIRQADHYRQANPPDPWDGRLQIINNPGEYPNLYSLAFAFMMTRDPLYVTRAREIIFGWPDHPDGLLAQSFTGDGDLRVLALSIVSDLLWDSLTQSERNQILSVVYSDITVPNSGLRARLTHPALVHDNNHMTRKARALLYAAIVFNGDPAYPDANRDIAFIRNRILLDPDNIVVRMIDSEGAGQEGPYYGCVMLHHLIPLMHAMSRWDNTDYFQMQPLQSRLAKISSWFAQEVLPAPRDPFARQFNSINDSYRGFFNSNGLLTGLLLLGGAYQDPLATWVFENTIEDVANILPAYGVTDGGWQRHAHSHTIVESIVLYNDMVAPEPAGFLPRSKYFPERGLYYVHADANTWAGQNDIQFSLTASPAIDFSLNPPNGIFSIKHNQPDKNSISLSAYGKDFIVDLGYEWEAPEHQNYILVNGRGQPPEAIFGGVNGGRIVQQTSSNNFDFIHGDAREGFNTYYVAGPNGEPVPVVDPTNALLNADRYVLSTRAGDGARHTFVVADDIQKSLQNLPYVWRFNTFYSPSGTGTPSDPIIIDAADGKITKIWYVAQGIPSFSSTLITLPPFSPTAFEPQAPHVIPSSPTQAFDNRIATNAINPYFHVVMIPYDATDPYPTVANQIVSNGSCFKLTWPSHEDYSFFKHTGTLSASFVNTDGKLSRVRKGISSGLPSQFAMANGSNFTFETRELINLYGAQGTVMKEGSSVSMNGTIGYFRVYCPSASSVKLNGNNVPFVQVGDYVEPANITISREWSGNISTTYDVTIPPSATLTIDQGSIFSFGGNTLTVNGALVADGVSGNPITMTSNGVWGGITSATSTSSLFLTSVNISNAQTAINASAESNLQVRYCTFNGCDVGVNVYAAPFGQTPQMEISNNTFSNFNLNCTGVVIAGTSNVLLTSNVLSGRREKGVGVFLNASSPQMQQNAIENWKRGIVCVNGSSPSLEQGLNIISGNTTGILCDNSDAVLSLDQGENDICLNDIDVTLVKSKAFVIKNRWRFDEDPPGIFEIDGGSFLEYNPWSPPTPNCGGLSPIVGNEKGKINDGSMSLISPLMRQIFRERQRGNFAAADGLIRAAINNRNVPDDVKLWALGQLLAVGQRMRTGNLASFISSLSSNGTLARKARTLLPMSFMHEGSLTQAIAAYDANVRDYPNSSEARAGLYGKFSYQLFNRLDTMQARAILNRLSADYPLSVEKEIAELQMSSFSRLAGSSSPSSNPTGGIAKGESASSATSSLRSIPTQFALSQNYPNPFNPTTTISYDLPGRTHVSLVIYDVLGRKVAELENGTKDAGYHSAVWNAGDAASGVYFARFIAIDASGSIKLSKVNKLLLAK